MPENTIQSLVKSIAGWSETNESWSWLTLSNYEIDDIEGTSFDKKIVIYHASAQKKKRRPSPRALRRHRALYTKYKPEQVWLVRHGRDDAFVCGWDGSPPEFQSLFQGQQHFAFAAHLTEWQEALASPTTTSSSIPSLEVFVSSSDNFRQLPSTSDKEDAGLKRAQRQALKREMPSSSQWSRSGPNGRSGALVSASMEMRAPCHGPSSYQLVYAIAGSLWTEDHPTRQRRASLCKDFVILTFLYLRVMLLFCPVVDSWPYSNEL